MKIELRPIARTDLPYLMAWRNRNDIRRRCREYRFLTEVNQKDWYEADCLDGKTAMFSIWAEDATGFPKLVGACGLTGIDFVAGHAEVSLYVGPPEARHKGIGLLCLDRLAHYAFTELRLHRLYAEIYGCNVASQRLFEKAGYVLEGTMREHVFVYGGYYHSLIYGLTEGDWDARD